MQIESKKREAEKKEDERILSQLELFPAAAKEDMRKTLRLLKDYIDIRNRVEDYRDHEEDIRAAIQEGETARRLGPEDLYANKTANAMIVAMNQKAAAEELAVLKKSIDRAINLIRSDEVKQAVTLRYIKGYSYSDTCRFMHYDGKSSTVDRRIGKGIASIAGTLKLWGVLDMMPTHECG
ncbi:hypothetical protein SAMN02799630_01210 [Paenibacillus sp. UNCCL117]|uniref:hypothetical protein n=1 Tax=unclassified Paenibacillus TaxID=185978 RepID=UPI00088C3459|nr:MULTISPECIES: hypothetical protein [unclassified Paenibacillus]SDC69604.1 hypothetical protein SAMN04488602_103188 [Paenibacillus sp. cl123]SFW23979.1 hypothetical protein SAMN02799630_01210 [Paenibacillus sp. UNCCL117]